MRIESLVNERVMSRFWKGSPRLMETADDGFDCRWFAGGQIEHDRAFVVVRGRTFRERIAPDRGGFAILDVAFHGLTDDLEDLVSLHAGGDARQLAFREFLTITGFALAEVFDAGPGLGPGVTVRHGIPSTEKCGNGDEDQGDDEVPVFLHFEIESGQEGALGNRKTCAGFGVQLSPMVS